MMTWWNSLTGLEQIMAMIAIPATVILILQTIMLLFSSFDGSSDSDNAGEDGHDGHGEYDPGLRIFTVRGFIAFFTIFGWSGLVFLRNGLHPGLAMPIALLLGFIAMLAIAYIFYLFLKLEATGNADISSAIGVSGTVYIPIPASRGGLGKVSAIVSGRLSEYDAVTDSDEPLKSGTAVTVTAVTGQNTLVVIKK